MNFLPLWHGNKQKNPSLSTECLNGILKGRERGGNEDQVSARSKW